MPSVSLAETTPEAEQLEVDGLQRLIGGETTTAIAPLETALGLYQAANDEAGTRRIADMLWVAYGSLGLEQKLEGDTAALNSYQRQLEFANLLQDAAKLTHSYLNIGSGHLWLEHWTEARRWLNQGVEQARLLPANTPSVPSGSHLERGLRLLLVLESILNNGPQVIALADELRPISASFETDFLVQQALGSAYLLQG
ncbi:hypothetical protein, partial [Okeania sp. SIO2G5]|uniref:hypothetical protein n=1 Tax=Okeania sp. SIO2G5 TaxID=2607796 RepID=UPI0013C1EBD6